MTLTRQEMTVEPCEKDAMSEIITNKGKNRLSYILTG